MSEQIVSSSVPKPLYQFADQIEPVDLNYAAFITGLLIQHDLVQIKPGKDGSLISVESVDDWRLTTQILANCIAHLRRHTEDNPGSAVELPFRAW